MMQAPDIGQMIMHHTSDAHEIALEWPWGGESVIHLPQWAPLHVGGMTIDVSPTKHVVFMLLAATLVWLTMFVAGRVRGTCTDVLGVFSVQGLAEQACTTPDDFVGPMRLDVRDTDDVHPWADQYFPLREGRRE